MLLLYVRMQWKLINALPCAQWFAERLLSGEKDVKKIFNDRLVNLPKLPTSDGHNASFYRKAKRLPSSQMITDNFCKWWGNVTPPLLHFGRFLIIPLLPLPNGFVHEESQLTRIAIDYIKPLSAETFKVSHDAFTFSTLPTQKLKHSMGFLRTVVHLSVGSIL